MLVHVQTLDKKVIQVNPTHVASVEEGHSAVTIRLVNGEELKMSSRDWLYSQLRQEV